MYCGFCTESAKQRFENLNLVHEMLNSQEKLRIYQGDGNPIDVIIGVLNGMDLFEAW